MKDTKNNLFIELAEPDIETGISRWVDVSEFVGRYKSLELGNGGSWCRKESTLAKVYIIEFDKNQTAGNRIDRIKLNGLNKEDLGSQQIRADIKKVIKAQRCVILATSNPEVDHKNGRKNDLRVMTLETQNLDDFQPLSKAANDAKRQICKECRNTENRFDAKKIGYPISVTKGGLKYENDLGCIGCFWYDPIDFRKNLKGIDESLVHKILNI